MVDNLQDYCPIPGKTYSLFGRSSSTERYYELIKRLADECVPRFGNDRALLHKLRTASGNKRLLRKAREGRGDADLVFLLRTICQPLSEYTTYLQKHLDEMPFYKFWDRRLRTSEEQYHLYMLEIELANRVNLDSFRGCEKKIALLQYCLQDWSGKCKSSMADFDYVCRSCSKRCYINRVSSFLREHDVTAYIWMAGDIKKIRQLQKSTGKLGGLGIACVPELVHGMRSCAPLGIPVIGIPLDANRCIRWTGTFYQNSVSLSELQRLFL